MIKLEELKQTLPRTLNKYVSEEFVDNLNNMIDDPQIMDTFRENLLGHISILQSSRHSMEEYVNAVKFITYKLVGKKDIDAYAIVFPDRYNKLINKGLDRSEIGPYVSAYNKSKLVVKLLEQTLIPSHIINAPLHQKAINELVNIGLNGTNEMARVNALSKVAELTKMPEETKIKLDIGYENNNAIDELRQATQELARQQKLSIESGSSKVIDIAHSKVIKTEK